MASKFTKVFVIMGMCLTAHAHDVITTKVTWSREISRLVYKRCGSCHREGGSSFSLMTYQEARPWAKALKEETLERRMPPWGAVKGFGTFRDDQGLTMEDLELISDWVEGGAPEGDPRLLPKTPDFGLRAREVKPGAELIVDGSVRLAKPLTVTGIRAKSVLEGKSVQVIAERPDGTIEPLLWLYNYKPEFDRTYVYASPVVLPAGTRVKCWPAGDGAVALQTSASGEPPKRRLQPGLAATYRLLPPGR